MRFGIKSHYALLALVDVAKNGEFAPVRLTEIATRQGLPLPYLEQLFNQLKRKGLVNSVRGQKGGYNLCNKPQLITIAEVFMAIDEPLQVTRCGDNAHSCQSASTVRCHVHTLWQDLEGQIYSYLSQKTLADLCATSRMAA